jgi:hypothetical protein
MADINPYAAPQHDVVVDPLVIESSGGVWRDGKLLVMHKQAVLPDRCVKCNQPARGRRLKRSLSWHHPGYFLAVLAGVWVYIIVALVVRHTAKIEIGMCDVHRRKRWQAIATSWLLALVGILAMFGGAMLDDAPAAWLSWMMTPWLILGGIALFFGGMIYAVTVVPPVAPQKIDKEYVWLKKVDPAFVAEFPPITG